MKKKTQAIFDAFTKEMERKLVENDHKHPDNTTSGKMYRALRDEIDELILSMNHDYADVPLLCANIANYAMFIAYHEGTLDLSGETDSEVMT